MAKKKKKTIILTFEPTIYLITHYNKLLQTLEISKSTLEKFLCLSFAKFGDDS